MDPAKAVQEYKERLKANQNEIEQLQKTLGKTVSEKEFLQKKADELGI